SNGVFVVVAAIQLVVVPGLVFQYVYNDGLLVAVASKPFAAPPTPVMSVPKPGTSAPFSCQFERIVPPSTGEERNRNALLAGINRSMVISPLTLPVTGAITADPDASLFSVRKFPVLNVPAFNDRTPVRSTAPSRVTEVALIVRFFTVFSTKAPLGTVWADVPINARLPSVTSKVP